MRMNNTSPVSEFYEGSVVSLKLHCEEYQEESYLELTLAHCSQKFLPPSQNQRFFRFWSPSDLRVTTDDSGKTSQEFILTKVFPNERILVQGYLQGALAASITFMARAVEDFEELPVRWDMIIDESANLCLWKWCDSSGHKGVMHEDLDIPQPLTTRLNLWIQGKRLGISSAAEMDTEGKQLATLIFPYLDSSAILYLYSETRRHFERIIPVS
jgi:hypothetical protein